MAQKRRREQMMKRRQRRLMLICIAAGIGIILLSLGICLLVFDIPTQKEPEAAPAAAVIAYDANAPFSISDLTPAQLTQLRQQGRIRVSDGPRGISVGDPLEKILNRYPTDYFGDQPEDDSYQILYCASYFENQNGLMTALPPRGLLTTDSTNLIITLLAPTAAYPAGTTDGYGSYEHVYCVYTIEPDTQAISSIVLGIDQ